MLQRCPGVRQERKLSWEYILHPSSFPVFIYESTPSVNIPYSITSQTLLRCASLKLKKNRMSEQCAPLENIAIYGLELILGNHTFNSLVFTFKEKKYNLLGNDEAEWDYMYTLCVVWYVYVYICKYTWTYAWSDSIYPYKKIHICAHNIHGHAYICAYVCVCRMHISTQYQCVHYAQQINTPFSL